MATPEIQAQIDVAIEQFRFEEAGLRELLRGPVAQDLARRAIAVQAQAIRNASEPPRGGPNSGSEPGKGPAVRTGRLRGSITYRLGEDSQGPFADVGSAVLYAPYVELGTTRMAARPFLKPAVESAGG